MRAERLYQLLSKYHQNLLTEDEKSELFDFLEQDSTGELLSSVWNKNFTTPSSSLKIDREALVSRIMDDERLSFRKRSIKTISISRFQSAVAASIIFILFSISAVWIYQTYFESQDPNLVIKKEFIKPGGKLARMQFDDGTYVAFENIQRDTILLDKGVHIKVSSDGNVTYELLQKNNALTYTTVYTPKGGEYTLELSDGTKVWLNSESKIKYPFEFDRHIRQVEIEGEAYFEVAQKYVGAKRIPFKVITGSQTIEVLGTAFNINAYKESIYTTLVEGSVALTANGSKDRMLLTPNQQAVYNLQNGVMEKNDVDPYYFFAWKNGKFAFRNANIYKVMEDLARWYDIEVIYQGDFTNITYSGSISRLESFDEVIELIKLTNKFNFKIDGRRVTVSKY